MSEVLNTQPQETEVINPAENSTEPPVETSAPPQQEEITDYLHMLYQEANANAPVEYMD